MSGLVSMATAATINVSSPLDFALVCLSSPLTKVRMKADKISNRRWSDLTVNKLTTDFWHHEATLWWEDGSRLELRLRWTLKTLPYIDVRHQISAWLQDKVTGRTYSIEWDPERHADDPEGAGSLKKVASITSGHRGSGGCPAVKWTRGLSFCLCNSGGYWARSSLPPPTDANVTHVCTRTQGNVPVYVCTSVA